MNNDLVNELLNYEMQYDETTWFRTCWLMFQRNPAWNFGLVYGWLKDFD